jgi:peptidoglycan hydrolase-like protein with peptidoglycan-binding domain
MNPNSKAVWARVIFTLLMTGILGLSMMPCASAQDHGDIKKVQETLRDKGYYTAPVDGVMGPQTRAAIRQYQQSENLPVTGHLDGATAGKLGVGPESAGGEFKGAGRDVGAGGQGFGHEMKQGKPVAAGKDLGEGVGQGGKDVGKGVGKGGKVVGKDVGKGGKVVGKDVGKGGKDVGKDVKKAVDPGQ